MAILTQPQLSVLRVRLLDFRRNLNAYVRGIQDQIFKGFAFTPNQAAIKARYEQSLIALNIKLARLDGVIEGRSLDGQLITDAAVRALVESFKPDLDAMQQAVVEWNKSAPLGAVMGTVGNLGNAVTGSLNAVFDIVGSTATTGATAIRWLPWVILGVIVLPPALRVIAKARRQGVDAALESTADELDAAKEKAKTAARNAGQAAVKAGKLLFL
jgi:hypothetical protein